MASTISFGDGNRGFQAGIINGPVNNEFHLPPGKLPRIQAGLALTIAPTKSGQKLHLARHLQCLPSAETQTLSSIKEYSIGSSKNAPCPGLGLRWSVLVVLGAYNQQPNNGY